METANRIQPYSKNRRYWQVNSRPNVLLGGSIEDNLFQISNLEAHLALLHSCGGNYVRCTMSSRNKGNLWPFARDKATGLYDLQRPEQKYWSRFERLLTLTAENDIIVQIEVWDRSDFSQDAWLLNPFNPKNNANYTKRESGLASEYPDHSSRNVQPFFYSVPALKNNALLLRYQQTYLDKLLSISLRYKHILYCVDNKNSGSPEWGKYWTVYLREAAQFKNETIFLTETWDPDESNDVAQEVTLAHSQQYDFVEVSQSHHISAEARWANVHKHWQCLVEQPCPMNMVKIYGAGGNTFGQTDDDGIACFWHGLLGGVAALRFHCPPSGLGLSTLAQANLRSARQLLAKIDIFECVPDHKHQMFAQRSEDSAYLTSKSESQHVIYFPRKGNVVLKLSGEWQVHWLDILESSWRPTLQIRSKENLPLSPPKQGHWVALLTQNRAH